MSLLVKNTKLMTISPKAIILTNTEQSQALYIILRGRATMSYRTRYNKTIYNHSCIEGDFLGLHSFINKDHEEAKVIADGALVLAVLENKALDIIKKDKKTMKVLNEMHTKQKIPT